MLKLSNENIMSMKQIAITIPEKSQTYTVFVGKDILQNIAQTIPLEKFSKIAIITDSHVQHPWLSTIVSNTTLPIYPLILSPGEQGKNIETVMTIWKHFLKQQLDRNSLVINLGGGVIGDMGGFAASTYMRGIKFVQIPTSITSQVDAMVGGKLGVNLGEYKNYIGTFKQPYVVIIDTSTLQTLPKRAFLEGFAEIIKHGLIMDKKYFGQVTAKKPFDFTSDELIEVIAQSIRIKARVVELDETEQGLRKILNFGHTIGHAIESLSFHTENPLMHGEAIHLGMIVETKISELQHLLSHEESERIIHIFKQTGLPTEIHSLSEDDIIRTTTYDKKMHKGILQWTLLEQIGKAKYNQKVPEAVIRSALQEIL